jgi:hypothetical protein
LYKEKIDWAANAINTSPDVFKEGMEKLSRALLFSSVINMVL